MKAPKLQDKWRFSLSIDTLKSALPDYAKDIKLNIGSLANETILNDQQKYGCMLACAYAIGTPGIVKGIKGETEDKLSEEAATAAKAAAAIMGMNNVYYRSLHLVSNETYRTLPARLRMNVIGKPGIEKSDFELFCMAVSAINGCGMCLDSHEAELRKAGMTSEQIQASIRIASVINAAARILAAEHAAE